MSASLRNQRLRLYDYSNVGTGGIPDERYTFLGKYWGRLSALGAKQFTVGAQGEHIVTAVASFADEVSVPQNGAVVLNGAVYLIRGTLPRRLARELDVLCEFCDDAVPTLVGP